MRHKVLWPMNSCHAHAWTHNKCLQNKQVKKGEKASHLHPTRAAIALFDASVAEQWWQGMPDGQPFQLCVSLGCRSLSNV